MCYVFCFACCVLRDEFSFVCLVYVALCVVCCALAFILCVFVSCVVLSVLYRVCGDCVCCVVRVLRVSCG